MEAFERGASACAARVVLFFLVVLIVQAIVATALRSGPADATSLGPLRLRVAVPLAAVVYLVTLVFLRLERRSPSLVGLGKWERLMGQAALGTVLGAGVIVVFVVLGAVSGSWALRGIAGLAPGTIALVIGIVVAAGGEELLYRGYPLGVLLASTQRRGTQLVAVAVTALLFGAAHLGNPSATPISFLSTSLAGWVLGMLRLRTGTLWAPIGFHVGWNLALGPVFGFAISGFGVDGAIVTLEGEGSSSGTPWWGGAHGPEGSVVMLTLLVVLAVLAALWRSKPGQAEAVR